MNIIQNGYNFDIDVFLTASMCTYTFK